MFATSPETDPVVAASTATPPGGVVGGGPRPARPGAGGSDVDSPDRSSPDRDWQGVDWQGVDWSDQDWSEPAGALPDTFEIMAPGAGLGSVLAAVDRCALSGAELVAVAQARARQIAHEQAQQMADLVAIASRCVPRMSYPGKGWRRRGDEPVDHGADEIAAALTWTRATANRQLQLAERLIQDLPAVHEQLLAGRIDWPKAKLCSDMLGDLDPDAATRVLDVVLPDASRQTTGRLRFRLAQEVIKADPEAALRRYHKGLTQRRVEHGREHDGTASLSGRFLPAERAAAANARIQAIADWIKNGGDKRNLDQIRTDILLDLLQGLPIPGPDGQDPHPLPGDPTCPTDHDQPHDRDNSETHDSEAHDGDDREAHDGDGDPRRSHDDEPQAQDSDQPDGRAGEQSDARTGDKPDEGRSPETDDGSRAGANPPTHSAKPTHHADHEGDRRGDAEPTSDGEDAESGGDAEPARHPDGAGCDADAEGDGAEGGRDSGGGTQGRGRSGRSGGQRRSGRPGACSTCGNSRLTRGLELTAPIATLLGLSEHPGQLGSWGPVLAEVARALVNDLRDAPWRISLTDDDGRVIWHGPIRNRPSPADRRRHPNHNETAHLRARDRRCRFPGCRRPAGCAQIDHTQPYAHDGPTDIPNLECLCVRHHLLKTAGLWKAHQTQHGGVIVWTSHLGRTYTTHPEPIEEPQRPPPPITDSA